MKKRKIVSYCVLAAAVMILSFSIAFGAELLRTEKSGDNYYQVVRYEDVSAYRNNPEEMEGYLFAGWFKEESCEPETALTSEDTEGVAYAKYVPQEILGLKAQISGELWDTDTTNDENAAIRFVTSVDSLNYSKIGFMIDIGNGAKERASSSVYKTLFAKIGEQDANGAKTEEYKPEEIFHSASVYFKTFTVTGITSKNYNTSFTVVPFWETLDGTIVRANQGVKSVNQGRSWDYVFVDDSGDDSTGVGTRQKPYKTLDEALNQMKTNQELAPEIYGDRESNGTVYVLNTLTAADGFTWSEHGLDIVMQGDRQSSTFDFTGVDMNTPTDNIKDTELGDAVTFKNLTLNLSARLHANGHRLKIDEDVISDNKSTIVHGGAYKASVKDTDVTILAGNYRAVYGGGCVGGVNGDTHVVLRNTNIYNMTTKNDSRVHGGSNRGTVTGNTYVTIGTGFNAGMGSDYTLHHHYGSVYGGGFSSVSGTNSIVKGDTFVVVEDNAKANYVYGGGYNNSEVQGTCHVEYKNGYTMSVYGGSGSTSATNGNTVVTMTGGVTDQIFGGSYAADVVGNTSVQILGGTVQNRVYGGCYNEWDWSWSSNNTVTGTTAVTIAPGANVATVSDDDTSVVAVSRAAGNGANETGIFVMNAGVSATPGFRVAMNICGGLYTNYLVQVQSGGLAVAENGVLKMTPNASESYVVVKDGSTVLYCGQGEGTYTLPELADKSAIKTIQVQFTDTIDEDVINSFDVKGTTGSGTSYYATLEEAVNAVGEEGMAITVLKDITIDSAMTIKNDVTITCEQAVTISKADEVSGSVFDVQAGTLTLQGLTGDKLTFDGNKTSEDNTVARLVRVSAGASCVVKDVIAQNFSSETGAVMYLANGATAEAENCQFTNNAATTSTGGALNIVGGASASTKNCTFTGNTATGNAGAVYCAGTYEDINSTFTGNSTVRNGGAVFAISGGQVSMVATTATISENTAGINGSAGFVQNDGSKISIIGYQFTGDTAQTIQTNGTLAFANIPGATIVQGANGILKPIGTENAALISITPGAYTEGRQILTAAEGVEASVFTTVCENIKITPQTGGKQWILDEAGKLVRDYVARIGEGTEATYYDSFAPALSAANAGGGTIYLRKNVELSAQQNITGDVTICNEPGLDITISRTDNVILFNIGTGNNSSTDPTANAALSLGTNAEGWSGNLYIDDLSLGTVGSRLLQSNGTFTLAKNATIRNIHVNNAWGSVMINRCGEVHLYGSIQNTTCEGATGGAILQYNAGGNVIIHEGVYENNVSTKAGSKCGLVYVRAGAFAEILGGSFDGNLANGNVQDIYAAGTVRVANANNVVITEDTTGVVEVKENATLNKVTVIPATYAEGTQVLTKGEGTSDETFAEACRVVNIPSDGSLWSVDANGQLQTSYVAYYNGTGYDTLAAAVTAANSGEGGTVFVRHDAVVSANITVNDSKNITITNEPGFDVTITRSSGALMFKVGTKDATSAVLTLGSNDADESGSLTINADTATATGNRVIDNFGTFTLGRNVSVINAKSTVWGNVLINRTHTAHLYGSMMNNTSSAACGPILQNGAGKTIIYEGTYSGNSATRVASGSTDYSLGGVIYVNAGSVEISGGTFKDNTSTGDGGVIYVKSGAKLTITGGTFSGNTAGRNGNAIYNAGTATINGAIFAGDVPQTVHVVGTITEGSDVPAELITR